MGPPARARVGRGTSHRRRRTARDQALHRVTHRGAPLALHLRTRAAAHAAIRELPRRRGSQPRWIAAGASAHAAPLLWIRAGQPRLRPSIDPRLPWPPRSQAHRPLHARCGRTLRGPLALSLSVTFTVLERWAFLASQKRSFARMIDASRRSAVLSFALIQ